MGLNIISAASNSSASQLGVSFATQALSRALSAQARLQQSPSSPGGTIPFLRRADSQVGQLSALGQSLSAQVSRFSSVASAFDTTGDLVVELNNLATQAISADAGTRTTLNAAAQNIIGTIFDDFSASRQLLSEFFIPVAIQGGTNANNTTIGSVSVGSSTRTIDAGGLAVDVDILGADTGTARRAGSRAIRGNAINNGGTGVTNAVTEFVLSGNRGSQNFLFAAGVSLDDVADAINEEKLNTGVEAYRDAAGHIDLYSIDFGFDATVALAEIQNTGQLSGTAGVTGRNARATFTLATGESLTVEAEGRRFQFELGGFDFDINFITSLNESTGAAFLTEGGGADLLNRGFTVFEGGANIDPTQPYGSKLAIPELQASSLGASLGGLNNINLETNPGRALEILDVVSEDLAIGQTKIANALATLSNRLSGVVDSAATLETGIQNFENYSDLVNSFAAIRAQSAANSSNAVVSQVAQIYPAVLNLFISNR